MDIKRVHLMREILVYDRRGALIPTMQFSCESPAHLHPDYLQVPPAEQASARVLYAQLGGRRPAGQWSGSTVIIPNPSRWSQLLRGT
jgi:hypothetical protein